MHPTLKKLLDDIQNEDSGFDPEIDELEWKYTDTSVKFIVHQDGTSDCMPSLGKGIGVMMLMGVLNMLPLSRILPDIVFTLLAASCVLSLFFFFGKAAILFLKEVFGGGDHKTSGDVVLHVFIKNDQLKFQYVEGEKLWSKIIEHTNFIHDDYLNNRVA